MYPVSSIDGVSLTTLRQIADDRGAVLHMLRADAEEFTVFGECYFSEIKPGFFKAWKRHLRQTQNLAVPVGRVKFVLLDDRPDSVTRGNVMDLTLGRPDCYRRLRIPPGIIYGFECISEEIALVVNCPDEPHDPLESEVIEVSSLESIHSWSGGLTDE
jgi:dTDP-4-dehydrorhamnose 3,5-epimerase